jgi:hypothetical protein
MLHEPDGAQSRMLLLLVTVFITEAWKLVNDYQLHMKQAMTNPF